MRTLLVLFAVVAGCATGPQGTCESSAEHVASCTGETATYRDQTTCDGGRAEALLDMECAELEKIATTGRTAGWWDEFMCQLSFSDRCGTTENGRTVVGIVSRADGTPAENVYVRMMSPGNPYAQVKGGYTTTGGVFAVQELTPQAYRLEVAMSPTGAALSAATVGSDQPYIAVAAPIP